MICVARSFRIAVFAIVVALTSSTSPARPAGKAEKVGIPTALPGKGMVSNGVDVLVEEKFKSLKGLRIGLITNHSGTDRDRNHLIDLLIKAPGVKLKALFSPEHGIRGESDSTISDGIDAQTGLPVYSLFGKRPPREPADTYIQRVFETRKPKPEHLAELDALVFDIQDIGCRFYTYVSTMGLCMEAAKDAGIRFIVLDRANPINGVAVQGPVQDYPISFIGFHDTPLRHGMTVGELARMFNEEKKIHVNLTVIPLRNWKRDLWFDQTGLPWINPSPNIRNLNQAILYPGVGVIEGANISVGRGTDTPFEVVGAPYIDGVRLAADLNDFKLEGVRFEPIRFTPTSTKFPRKECGGVRIVLMDRNRCNAVDVGLAIAQAVYRLYPEDFDIDRLQRHLGHPPTLSILKSGKSLAEIRQTWSAKLEEFEQRRSRYLLYN
ncbi:MAG: DUF1343 domain-containing protein [Verrucomicrobia bacterium]|nr:DUF1343 domain-containing protein [Verrucomicrobiota bacterium]